MNISVFTDDPRVVRSEVHGLVCELWGEVGQVPLALQSGPVRGRDLLLLQQCPVNGLTINTLSLIIIGQIRVYLEEGVSHNLDKS